MKYLYILIYHQLDLGQKINIIMLLDEKIKIKVSQKNIKHLKLNGYNCELKDVIDISTKDINEGSHIKIRVKCDVCGNEKELL